MAAMNIRNFPEELLRELRVEALGAGVTLRELVIRRLVNGHQVARPEKANKAGETADLATSKEEIRSSYQQEPVLEAEPNWVLMPGEKRIKMCRVHKDRYCVQCELD